ncbi:uncharacterized protein LOC131151881 [Malania oleifera]|uniref:uncharacterized protein LOC131151881 n=1 Tax=Malania oleifera TaxID=397392 RepID=UPI0025ADDBD5|nr:uncharacterized protein LOC131151881 [Malania oleifera]XP_057959327.1 uncharacterized protein LOC131151881 [Malania oleifera]
MDKNSLLPFNVGQLAESRSFLVGFRGAWFRCRIKEIGSKRGHLGHVLEYFDFPDEKINWTKLYQRPQIPKAKGRDIKMQLMVRPSFPKIYRESQLPDINAISEVVVIVNDAWKVGDLVDWWTDGCFWCGRISQILDDGKVQVELPPPPLGEGLSYEVSSEDLRPSLDWCPEVGWTVPTPTELENCCPCARLIQPVNQVQRVLPNLMVDEERRDGQGIAGSPTGVIASFSSHISGSSVPPPDRSEHSLATEMSKQPLSSTGTGSKKEMSAPETNMDLDVADGSTGRTSLSDSVSSSHFGDDLDGLMGTKVGKDRYSNSGSSKKMRTGGDTFLNSMCSDTLEASILDLEELANKVKWLKGILEFGIPLSNAVRPPWKFLEHRAPSMQK